MLVPTSWLARSGNESRSTCLSSMTSSSPSPRQNGSDSRARGRHKLPPRRSHYLRRGGRHNLLRMRAALLESRLPWPGPAESGSTSAPARTAQEHPSGSRQTALPLPSGAPPGAKPSPVRTDRRICGTTSPTTVRLATSPTAGWTPGPAIQQRQAAEQRERGIEGPQPWLPRANLRPVSHGCSWRRAGPCLSGIMGHYL